MTLFIQYLDYVGVVVFAITGCLIAARKQVDLVGFVLLATVTAIGGGTMRDILLDRPVFWIDRPVYLALCTLTALAMFVIARHVEAWRRLLVWADAVGIAVFTVIGVDVALGAGAHWSVAILMGIMTATFGGIIRDILSDEPTLVMRREVYVTACFAGACVYLAGLLAASIPNPLAAVMSLVITFAIRGAAIQWRLHLPGYGEEGHLYRRKSD